MNKICFFLKDPKADKKTSIKLHFSSYDGLVKYYTGETIHPDNWNFETQCTSQRGTKSVLNRIIDCITQLDVDARIKGIPLTKKTIISSLDKIIKHAKSGGGDLMYDVFKKIIQHMHDGKVLTIKTHKRYSSGTIGTIEHTSNILNKFSPNLRFNEIGIDTYFRFINFCYENNFSINYTGTLIKNWKILLFHSAGKYHDNRIFESKEFKKVEEEAIDIRLNGEEIELIFNVDVSEYPGYDLVRDWYILGSFLGLRISDLVSLNDKNKSEKSIIVINDKTGEIVVIPLHPIAKIILNKYNGFPPAITAEYINRVIKKIAQLAGINSRVAYSITKGGKRLDYYLEKWEMISTHTMRRSFITNSRAAGVPDSIVMKLAGIKSPRTLQKYDKITAEEAAEIAAEHHYFK